MIKTGTRVRVEHEYPFSGTVESVIGVINPDTGKQHPQYRVRADDTGSLYRCSVGIEGCTAISILPDRS